jgi:hypothetical protein
MESRKKRDSMLGSIGAALKAKNFKVDGLSDKSAKR